MNTNIIPYGNKCYIKAEYGKDLCFYYQYLEDGSAGCLLLGADCESSLLSDLIKVCGINELDEEISLGLNNNECSICGIEFQSLFQGYGIVCSKKCEKIRDGLLGGKLK